MGQNNNFFTLAIWDEKQQLKCRGLRLSVAELPQHGNDLSVSPSIYLTHILSRKCV